MDETTQSGRSSEDPIEDPIEALNEAPNEATDEAGHVPLDRSAEAPDLVTPETSTEALDLAPPEPSPEATETHQPHHPHAPYRKHSHDPQALRTNHAVFMALYALIGVGAVLYGLTRLSARPDLRLDYLIVFAIGALFIGLAARRWLAWKALESELPPPPPPAPPSDEISEFLVGSAALGAASESGTGETEDAGQAMTDDGGPAGDMPPVVLASSLAMAPAPTRRAPEPELPPLYGRREATLAAILMPIGLVLALYGQMQLDMTHLPSLAVGILFMIAGGLWLVALVRTPERVADGATPTVPGPGMTTARLNALILGLVLVVFPAFIAPKLGPTIGETFGLMYYPIGAYPAGSQNIVFAGSGTLTLFGGGMWLIGVILIFRALVDWERVRARWRAVWDGEGLNFRLSRTAIAVIAIMFLGAWFRFHDLSVLPFEMTSDHTEKLNDIKSIVGGLRPVFMPANSGREPMQFYWTALLVAMGLPLSFMTMKIGMAIIGTLTIPLIYRLGREVVDRELGLMAALVFAMVPWHIQITRVALRIAFAPLWVAVTLIFLYRALASGRRNDWLLMGASLGLGMYGYSAFRPMVLAVPLIVVLKLAHDAFSRRRTGEAGPLVSRSLAGHLAASGGVAFLMVMPFLRYALDQWAAVFERTGTRMFQDEIAYENPIFTQFLINVKNALLMFNLIGDSAWFQSPSSRPALETVGGALLILGLAVVLHRIWRRDWRLGTLVVIIPIMLLSSIMALAFPRENPSLSRASAALPMIVVLVALPLPVLAARWRAAWGSAGTLAYAALLVVLFVWMGRETEARYFGEYRASYDSSTHNTTEGADVIRAFITQGGDIDHAYYVGWENGWDFRALGFLLGHPEWSNLVQGANPDWSDAATGASAHADDPARKIYLVGGPYVQQQIDTLKSIYSNAIVTQHRPRVAGKDFWSVFVPDMVATPTATVTPAPTMTPPITPEATENSP